MPYSFNGCGTMFYGSGEKNDDGTFVTTEWVTFLWLPLFPLRSFRIKYEEGTKRGFFLRNSLRYSGYKVKLNIKQVLKVYIIAAIVMGAFSILFSIPEKIGFPIFVGLVSIGIIYFIFKRKTK